MSAARKRYAADSRQITGGNNHRGFISENRRVVLDSLREMRRTIVEYLKIDKSQRTVRMCYRT